MVGRRALLVSLFAVAACRPRSRGDALAPDEPVDTGFSGCTA